MRLPYLSSWDKTPVIVTITQEGIDENGVQGVESTYSGKCNFENVVKTVMTKDGKNVALGGRLTIRGDIAPARPSITGYVTVNGQERLIHSASKVLNPDGSVNHTRLELL